MTLAIKLRYGVSLYISVRHKIVFNVRVT